MEYDNVKKYKPIADKIISISEFLEDNEANIDNVSDALCNLHPKLSVEEIKDAVSKMASGIEKMNSFTAGTVSSSLEDKVFSQVSGMDSDQQKGYLLQLFALAKDNDAVKDSRIKDLKIDSSELANLREEQLCDIVTKQISLTAEDIIQNLFEAEIPESFAININSTKKCDPLVLAAAQYSSAHDGGSIDFDYTKFPEILGICAESQNIIANYSDDEDINETTNKVKEKFMEFLQYILFCAILLVFTYAIGVPTVLISRAVLTALESLILTGITNIIVDTLIVSVVVLSSAAVTIVGLAALIYGTHKLALNVISPRSTKFEAFYQKFLASIGIQIEVSDNDKVTETIPVPPIYIRENNDNPEYATVTP